MALVHPLIAGLVLSATAACATIPISLVDLVFEPELVQASPGDVLEFHFMPHNHSVVMGDFDRPCKAATSGGFYSGFFALASGEADHVFRVTVNDTKPFVYYCSQDAPGHQHCQAGMIGAVNSDNATLSKYKDTARQVEAADSPAAVFGGTLVSPNQASATTPSTSATVATSSSPAQPTAAGTAGRIGVGGVGAEAALAVLGALCFVVLMG